MKIKAQVFRDGTSQRSRSQRSLDPDYISVDERTLADWIRFVQNYAKDLTYFNAQNQPEGDWSAFFVGDAQAIADAVETLDAAALETAAGDSGVATISPDILQALAQPHLALFLTFLKLLRYPQQQFKALTQRRLDFYYRQVLRLAEKAATPEQAHVIFLLTPNQTDYLLPKGTRLSAGTDAQGNDLHYAVDSDLYITQAQVASVKTFSLEKIEINLEVIHLADDRTAMAFEKMLRWAIGTPNQGDALPALPATDPLAQNEDTLSAIVALFQEVRDYTLEQVTAERQQYILNQLNFATLEDFQFCFDVHSREMAKQQGVQEVVPSTELEWQQVYRLVKKAYRKKINRDRRDRLKQEHHSDQYNDAAAAFLGVWRFALGDPLPGDLLPFFPEQQEANLDDLLADLEGDNAEAAARYIQENLFLSVSDFQRMMDIQHRATRIEESPEWEEVYRLLERAQTRKRAFIYPPIGRTEIKTICATAIADTKPDQPSNQPLALPRFQPFVAQPLCESNAVQSLGVAISAPILRLQEGHRDITLTLACQAESFNRGILEELLALGEWPFGVTISSESGWLPIPPVDLQVAVGDFFLESPLRHYPQAALAPIYQAPEPIFDDSQAGYYLRFPDGSLYQIEAVLSPTRIRLSFAGKVAPSEAIEQYPNLALGGRGTVLNNIQLSDDRRELIASSNRFRATDVGNFIVLAGGEIYEIEQFANATRLGIRYWGYLPGSGEARKYPQLTFSSAPIAHFTDLTLTGMALTSSAEAGARFIPKDVGTHPG
ncbi:MAG: hypothetical protein F6K42_03065 [Leptolyngbya sp. SIO1D8]|nr:hypothetical protein [Leptolyngbya sp. SIO1D8]